MNNLKFILFWISQILSFPLLAQTVSNVQAEQVGKQIVITYSLDKQEDISVCYTTDGGKTFSALLKQVTGDVGRNIAAGNHTITWNVLEEVDKLIADDIMFVVIPSGESLTFTVNGVTFNMVKVEGGTFTMGATAEQGKDAWDNERPSHQVTLSDYYIGQTEVTQALWTAVMGSNPSWYKGDSLPVECVSWNNCQTFIKKLNRLLSKQLGGKRFALPTEAQWEFAARGGNKSKGYKYAGSNNLDDVAWYWNNCGEQVHPVAQKQPNELGLYDMSGNVWEWCQDWFGGYSSDAQTDPQGPCGTNRVYRGGGWRDFFMDCRVSYRRSYIPGFLSSNLGFRLCLIPVSVNQKQIETVKLSPLKETSGALLGDGTLVSFTVNGVTFKMVKVEGGTFTMGATAEQGDDAYDWERPAHQVTLSDYYIGQTEVTQALWAAVMGWYYSGFEGNSLPTEGVSWDDCQSFIEELNRLLSKQLGGMRFALPTEAQWEFAARGGNKSKGYKYAGSNNIDDVAWYRNNSGEALHPVAQKRPNELGLYDMSGNVREWCQDWFDDYSSNAQTNPQGPASGTYRVFRGGTVVNNARYCRVSIRFGMQPGYSDSGIGFRLCLIP